MASLLRGLVLCTLVLGAVSHAGLVFPVPRNNFNASSPREIVHPWTGGRRLGGPCAGSACLWFNEGCFPGCEACLDGFPQLPANFSSDAQKNYYGAPNCAAPQLQEPTLPERYRTWNIGNRSPFGDYTRYHPWRSPGHAPTSDPCGIAGGYAQPTRGGGETPMGAVQGDKGSTLPRHAGAATQWPAGGTAEALARPPKPQGGGDRELAYPGGILAGDNRRTAAAAGTPDHLILAARV